jgi:hypothetical protein
MRNGLPILAIVGHGRAGKDTVAEWLRDNTILRFKGGCSFTGCQYVADKLGSSWHEAWRTRHERRMEWYHILNEYRKDDPTRLVRDCLEHSDIVCGLRDREELLGAKAKKLFDLVIWVDRPVPIDPTVTFTVDDADLIIRNYTKFEDLYERLTHLAGVLKVLRSQNPGVT